MTQVTLEVEGELRDTLEKIFPTRVTFGGGDPNHFEFIYPKVTKAKLEIFADEHPPPHFRVTYDNSSANYSLLDGLRLSKNAELRINDREIHKWWKIHRLELAELWNSTRPYNCPVGPVRIPNDWISSN